MLGGRGMWKEGGGSWVSHLAMNKMHLIWGSHCCQMFLTGNGHSSQFSGTLTVLVIGLFRPSQLSDEIEAIKASSTEGRQGWMKNRASSVRPCHQADGLRCPSGQHRLWEGLASAWYVWDGLCGSHLTWYPGVAGPVASFSLLSSSSEDVWVTQSDSSELVEGKLHLETSQGTVRKSLKLSKVVSTY